MIMVANEEEKWKYDDSQGDGFFKFCYKDGNPIFVKIPAVLHNI